MKTLKSILFAALLPLAGISADAQAQVGVCKEHDGVIEFDFEETLWHHPPWEKYADGNSISASIEIEKAETGNGLKIRFTHPKGSWAGIHHVLSYGKTSQTDNYRCVDLRHISSIDLTAKGNARLRVQLIEGYEGEYSTRLGQAYEKIIQLDDKVKEHKIPLNEFKYRNDWQPTDKEIDKMYVRHNVSMSKDYGPERYDIKLEQIHSLTLEPLCSMRDKGCANGEERELTIYDIHMHDKRAEAYWKARGEGMRIGEENRAKMCAENPEKCGGDTHEKTD